MPITKRNFNNIILTNNLLQLENMHALLKKTNIIYFLLISDIKIISLQINLTVNLIKIIKIPKKIILKPLTIT
jgi:hypothetical protein